VSVFKTQYSQRDFAGIVKTYIDEQVAKQRVGLTNRTFDKMSDADLLMELIARGYQVSLPLDRVKDTE
jgi:hypothetical protein